MDFEMRRMFAKAIVNEATEKYGLKTIGARVREARKDKTFWELRRTVLDVVPKEVLNMEVYDKDKLGLSLINEIMPARLFDVTYGSAEMFSGEDEFGNSLLESEVPDEKLSEIDSGLIDLLNSNYQYERMAGEKSRQLLGLVIPMDETKRKVLDSIGIKQRE